MSKTKIKKPKYELGQEVQIFLEGNSHRATITGLHAYNYPYNGDVDYYCNTGAPYPNNLLLLREDFIYPLDAELQSTEVLFNEIQSLRSLCIVLDNTIYQEQEKLEQLKKREKEVLKQIRVLRKQLETAEESRESFTKGA